MTRWTSFVLGRRWAVLTVVVGAMLLGGLWGSGVLDRLSQGGDIDPSSEAALVDELLADHFGIRSPDIVAIYRAPDGKTVDDIGPAVSARLAEVDRGLLAEPIEDYWSATGPIRSLLRSGDGSTALAVVFVEGSESERIESFTELEPQLTVPGVSTELSGFSAIADEVNKESKRDLVVAEMVSLPVTLLVLVLVFGGLVGAAIPVAIGALSMFGALAALRLLSMFLEVSVFSVNIASLLGLGMAIDYGLFIVSRYREELAAGAGTDEAVTRTMASAGRTVAFSAVLLLCAFAGTLVFPQQMLKSLGFGAMAAVALAAVLSLTALPALLAILGPRIDALTWRRGAFERGEARAQRFWGALATAVMRRPVVIAVTIVTVLLLLTLPLLGTRFGDVDHTALPPGNETRTTVEQLTAQFPIASSGATIVIRGEDGAPPGDAAVTEVIGAIGATDGVQQAITVGTADGMVAVRAVLEDPDRSVAAVDTVRRLDEIEAPAGAELLLGGITALSVDSVNSVLHYLPVMIAVMVIATLVLMFFAFGSIVLPIKAVLMAALSLGATFGILTWIFYDGHLTGLLNVTPGPLISGMVVLIIAMVFGLSTDYEVFLISRMVEARRAGATTEEAVRIGAAKTGRVVTAAATLLILVTGAFTLSDLSVMRFIGVGMIVALIIDATVVRMLLVPALVKLMGEANWWAPASMVRLRERVNVH
ncbi:MMPL family transporter [Rhodococcus oryzae]|uniref:MMPL family transporter n=1 Tax=Rhodococcus oryzae TaxID=2571143 RepID=UPI0037A0402D